MEDIWLCNNVSYLISVVANHLWRIHAASHYNSRHGRITSHAHCIFHWAHKMAKEGSKNGIAAQHILVRWPKCAWKTSYSSSCVNESDLAGHINQIDFCIIFWFIYISSYLHRVIWKANHKLVTYEKFRHSANVWVCGILFIPLLGNRHYTILHIQLWYKWHTWNLQWNHFGVLQWQIHVSQLHFSIQLIPWNENIPKDLQDNSNMQRFDTFAELSSMWNTFLWQNGCYLITRAMVSCTNRFGLWLVSFFAFLWMSLARSVAVYSFIAHTRYTFAMIFGDVSWFQARSLLDSQLHRRIL